MIFVAISFILGLGIGVFWLTDSPTFYKLAKAIGIGFVFGTAGGFVSVILSTGYFVSPRKVLINDKFITFYGSASDLIIGATAGIISVTPFVSTSTIEHLLYVSLISGLGGSKVISGFLDKRVAKEIENIDQELSQFAVEEDESLVDDTSTKTENVV